MKRQIHDFYNIIATKDLIINTFCLYINKMFERQNIHLLRSL
jgi:hypothetical protein